MEIELNPLNLCAGPNMWATAIHLLKDNPEKVLPVYMEDPETGYHLGDYSLWFYKDGSKLFLVAENFSSPDFEQAFRIGTEEKWQLIQPGIYKIEVLPH